MTNADASSPTDIPFLAEEPPGAADILEKESPAQNMGGEGCAGL